MTVSSSNNKNRHEGNGVSTAFPFVGRIFSTSDLVVQRLLRSNNSVVDTLTLSTHYSVTINGPESATVTITDSGKIPSSLQDLLIYRSLARTQTLDLPTGTRFPAVSVENALDKITSVVQDLKEEVDRKVGIPITDSGEAPDVIQLLEDATEGATAAQTAAEAAQAAAEVAQAAAETAQTGAETAEANAEAWAATASVGNLGALTEAVSVSGDYIAFSDVSDSGNGKKDTILDAVTSTLLDEDDMASNSATRAPTQQSVKAYVDALSVGGWVPIKTVTASSSTSIDFVNGSGGVVLDSTYKAYAVVISSLVPATDNTDLYFRTSTNAGSSYDSGASDYTYAHSDGGTLSTTSNAAQISFSIGVGNAAGESLNAVVYVFEPSNASAFTTIGWATSFIASSGTAADHSGTGARKSAADVDAIRFIMSSGNITSGTFTLYGLASAA